MASSTQIFNGYQKQLRNSLKAEKTFKKAVDIMLTINSLVHPSYISSSNTSSFEDEIWNCATENDFRKIPFKGLNSIAWHLWHSSRIEDIATSYFITNKPQVYTAKNYYKKLNVPFRDTGNGMELPQMELFNSKMNLNELKKYRIDVGRATRKAMEKLVHGDMKRKVSEASLNKISSEGYVDLECKWLLDFWGKKNIAGIILMPLTRHLMVHINKSKRLLGNKIKN
jgi:hypothetical protein